MPATDRHHALGAFFAAHADELPRNVAAQARGLDHAVIEDACQTAWTILVRRADISLDARGLSWLVTVAVRVAWKRSAQANTEIPSGGLTPTQAAEADPGELPEPPAETRDPADVVADRDLHRQRMADLARVKPANRRALYLKGLGYTYSEIQRITDATYTAVNRRITEGRRDLRELARDRDEEFRRQGGENTRHQP